MCEVVVDVSMVSLSHLSFSLSLQQNCPKSILKCLADEVKVLTEELEAFNVPGMHEFPLIKNLRRLAVRIKKVRLEAEKHSFDIVIFVKNNNKKKSLRNL